MARARVEYHPPPGVELSPLPTIKGKDQAHAWITQTLGVPIRQNLVTAAANKREIQCVKIGAALYFSTQALFDWIVSLTERSTGTWW